MKNKILFIIAAVAIIVGCLWALQAFAQVSPNYWLLTGGNVKPISNSWGLQVVKTPCTGTSFYQSDANGIFQCGVPAGSGSASGTINNASATNIAYYNGTTTIVGSNSATLALGSAASSTNLELGAASSTACQKWRNASDTTFYFGIIGDSFGMEISTTTCEH